MTNCCCGGRGGGGGGGGRGVCGESPWLPGARCACRPSLRCWRAGRGAACGDMPRLVGEGGRVRACVRAWKDVKEGGRAVVGR